MGIFELNATLLAELAVFVIVVVVVAKVVLPPLRKAMAERQAVIQKGLADAEAAEVRLVEAETEYRRQLDLARREGKEILYAYRGMRRRWRRRRPGSELLMIRLTGPARFPRLQRDRLGGSRGRPVAATWSRSSSRAS